jgi:hypothetical protein
MSIGFDAIGSAPLSGASGPKWQDIPGATSLSYTTPSLVAGDNGAQYRLVVTNEAGQVVSESALLTVTSDVAERSAALAASLAVQLARNATAGMGLAVQAPATQSTSVGAAIQAARNASATVALAVQTAQAAAAAVSAHVQTSNQLATGVSLQVLAGNEVGTAVGLAVRADASASAVAGLAVSVPLAASVSAAAAVQIARNASTSVAMAVQATESASAAASAAIQQAQSSAAAVQASVRALYAQAFGASLYVQTADLPVVDWLAPGVRAVVPVPNVRAVLPKANVSAQVQFFGVRAVVPYPGDEMQILKTFEHYAPDVEIYEIDFQAKYLATLGDSATVLEAFNATPGINATPQVAVGGTLTSGVVRFVVPAAPTGAGPWLVAVQIRTAAGRRRTGIVQFTLDPAATFS